MDPADIANRALDAIGSRKSIGDLQEGTREAQVALRHYGQVMRQLFRAVHWNFARKRAPLMLLQDATGQTTQQQIAAGQPVTVGTGTIGQRPWLYEYRWPTDCVKARFVPMTQSSASPSAVPQMTNVGVNIRPWDIPTPFQVAEDEVPNVVGHIASWDRYPDTTTTMGQALSYQTVILSNQQSAQLVYTALKTDPAQWDVLFTQAFVAALASELAMPLTEPRGALAIRDNQIKIARAALEAARLRDGNEGWPTVDHTPDWIRARTRWGDGFWIGGHGTVGAQGYDAYSFCDGSAY